LGYERAGKELQKIENWDTMVFEAEAKGHQLVKAAWIAKTGIKCGGIEIRKKESKRNIGIQYF